LAQNLPAIEGGKGKMSYSYIILPGPEVFLKDGIKGVIDIQNPQDQEKRSLDIVNPCLTPEQQSTNN
jgi:hypothetical protein